MILSRDEAICTILEFSDNNTVTSPTKLNKLLARLNLHFIPVDIDFKLNRFGSFNVELKEITENQYFDVIEYELKTGQKSRRYMLKQDGKFLFFQSIEPKLRKILTKEDYDLLKSKILELSKMSAFSSGRKSLRRQGICAHTAVASDAR